MKELEQAIQTAFTNMVTSGQVTKIIETQIQKTVEHVFVETFRSYSPFCKALTDHVQKTLQVDFAGLGLAGYNETVLRIIKAKLDANVEQFAMGQISKAMDELLKTPPTEIKLSELVDLLKKHVGAGDGGECGVSCHVEFSDGSTLKGWCHVRLDEKPRQSSRDCRFDVAVTDKGEIYRISLPYSGDVTKRMFAGPFYGFECALFQMYAAKTRLIIDEDNVDTGGY